MHALTLRLALPPLAAAGAFAVALAACAGSNETPARSTPAQQAQPATARSASAREVGQWTVYGQEAAVVPGRRYGFLNTYNRKSLRYGRREYGINLEWDGARTGRHITFLRLGTSTEPITYGETVAIKVEGGGYLYYREREYGINLEYAPVPVYQWELAGGQRGRPVAADPDSATVERTGASQYRVRLYNVVHGDYVVYGERDYGINLRWWSDEIGGRMYPPFPFPAELRGPSGEPGQILLAGTAIQTGLFHGRSADELDWHIYLRPDTTAVASLSKHLLAHTRDGRKSLLTDDLLRLRVEWMVMDGYDDSTLDERFYSADVGTALGLGRPAWSYSVDAAGDQGTVVYPKDSKLDGARVYVQGPFVNDSDHHFQPEIHPLDSVAYALDGAGNPLTVGATDPRWPRRTLTWRVAAFANSSYHRIAGTEYAKKNRTTTWWLPLPGADPGLGAVVRPRATESKPGFENYAVARRVGGLDRTRPTGPRYADYGVAGSSYAIEVDPADGRAKLRVTVTMATPDFWGGMFLRDYTVTLAPFAKR